VCVCEHRVAGVFSHTHTHTHTHTNTHTHTHSQVSTLLNLLLPRTPATHTPSLREESSLTATHTHTHTHTPGVDYLSLTFGPSVEGLYLTLSLLEPAALTRLLHPSTASPPLRHGGSGFSPVGGGGRRQEAVSGARPRDDGGGVHHHGVRRPGHGADERGGDPGLPGGWRQRGTSRWRGEGLWTSAQCLSLSLSQIPATEANLGESRLELMDDDEPLDRYLVRNLKTSCDPYLKYLFKYFLILSIYIYIYICIYTYKSIFI